METKPNQAKPIQTNPTAGSGKCSCAAKPSTANQKPAFNDGKKPEPSK